MQEKGKALYAPERKENCGAGIFLNKLSKISKITGMNWSNGSPNNNISTTKITGQQILKAFKSSDLMYLLDQVSNAATEYPERNCH